LKTLITVAIYYPLEEKMKLIYMKQIPIQLALKVFPFRFNKKLL
jgi:hypothetical protein